MADSDSLLRDAEDKLEQFDGSGAREAYRAYLRQVSPEDWWFGAISNSQLAERLEVLQFWQELARLHPESERVRASLAQAHERAGSAGKAFELLDTLITPAHERDPVDELRLRKLRLGAALVAGFGIAREDVLRDIQSRALEDFLWIWRLGEVVPTARSFRRSLALEIVGLTSPRALPFLGRLIDLLGADPGLCNILHAKIQGLRALQEYKDSAACQAPRADEGGEG